MSDTTTQVELIPVKLTLQLTGRVRTKTSIPTTCYYRKEYPMPADVTAGDSVLNHLSFKLGVDSKETILCQFTGYDPDTRIARYQLSCAKANIGKYNEMLTKLGWEPGVELEIWQQYLADEKKTNGSDASNSSDEDANSVDTTASYI